MGTFSTGVVEGTNALHLHREIGGVGVRAESPLYFKIFSGSKEQDKQDLARLEAVFGLKDSNLFITHPDLHLFEGSEYLKRPCDLMEFDGRDWFLGFDFLTSCLTRRVEVLCAKNNWIWIRRDSRFGYR